MPAGTDHIWESSPLNDFNYHQLASVRALGTSNPKIEPYFTRRIFCMVFDPAGHETGGSN